MVVVSGSNPTGLRLLLHKNAEWSIRTTCITANSWSIEIVRTAPLALHGQIKNVIIEAPQPKSPTI